ncbi:unnamed protein product [Gongylonema pulchrum]|uniref:Uncharacterized protein n=1 Tax=Gongylonema pulchrum TaxID=637853 RepID=A0A183EJE3_9BILA|nr:unnamed protein product [Gongylonema pulchrum]
MILHIQHQKQQPEQLGYSTSQFTANGVNENVYYSTTAQDDTPHPGATTTTNWPGTKTKPPGSRSDNEPVHYTGDAASNFYGSRAVRNAVTKNAAVVVGERMNSEHPQPGRLPITSKNFARNAAELENEALKMLNERAKNFYGNRAVRNAVTKNAAVVVGERMNSEHPQPGRLPITSKNFARNAAELENEALKMLNERAKKLPPPLDPSQLLNVKRVVSDNWQKKLEFDQRFLPPQPPQRLQQISSQEQDQQSRTIPEPAPRTVKPPPPPHANKVPNTFSGTEQGAGK